MDEFKAGTLADVEVSARHMAENVVHMFGSFQASLHAITAISVRTLETYDGAVGATVTNVNANIEAVSGLIQQVDTLREEMAPIEEMALKM